MTDAALAERPADLDDIPLARDLVPTDRRLLPAPLERLQEAADIISQAGGLVPAELRKDPGACMAVAYMAALHGTDLVSTASQTYVVSGKIAFMAQYINALVQRHFIEKPTYTYQGQGPTRAVMVSAKLKGGQVISYSSPQVGQITVKNSPLWKTDPDQQLGYYAIRALARRHMPDVLLGIYAVEELQQITVRDVTPAEPDPFAAEEPEIEDAEVESGPFEPSGGAATDEPRAPHQESSAAQQDDRADDPLEWAEGCKQDIDDCADEPALVALFERTEANRRALFAADKAASKDLDDRFTQRQRELRTPT